MTTSEQPIITCAIICYNYGRFLRQAIDSCLAQTLDRSLFEVLVIDDGSTDDTPEICASYEGRIRVSRTENKGFAASLGRALHEARGTYVAYLDADDWWAPQKLAALLPHLQAGALVVMHPMHEVDDLGAPLGGRIGACGNTSSVCVEREAGITLLPCTSEIFCRPLLDCGKGRTLSEPLAYYRIHGKSMTDRSATSAHTEFFARTSHVTADRLEALQDDIPFWAASREELKKLAHVYRTEGLIKDFQRNTELRKIGIYWSSWICMAKAMWQAGRLPAKREFRLTARALSHLLRLSRQQGNSAS